MALVLLYVCYLGDSCRFLSFVVVFFLAVFCFPEDIGSDIKTTYSELISLGIVGGICEVPTQMMVSLEQVHPEGHLKFLLDSVAA